MYKPPPAEILNKLVGDDVMLVSFWQSGIHLDFESKDLKRRSQLTIGAPFRFGEKSVIDDSDIQDFPLVQSSLMRIAQTDVTEVSCEEDGTLWLSFSNGDVLVVYANDPMYEAYTMKIDGKEYVV